MLVELAVGDAYGAGFEYAPGHIVRRLNTAGGYATHPSHAINPGSYTDDTQMSIAIAETLVEKKPWTQENIAQKFVDAFQRDPRLGYASGFYSFLVSVRDAQDFLARIRPNSDRSGGAMRATPIGILRNVEEVMEKSALQASITHNTESGIKSAQVASLMAHYFIYNIGAKSDLGLFLEQYIAPSSFSDVHVWNKPYVGKVGEKGWHRIYRSVS